MVRALSLQAAIQVSGTINMQRLVAIWIPLALLTGLLTAALCHATISNPSQLEARNPADGLTEQPEQEEQSVQEEQARLTCERFLSVLKRQPRPGVALDRVYAFHSERGTLGTFLNQLKAEASTESDNGATWLLIGLVENLRSNAADAVIAFQHAESARPNDPLPAWMLGKSLSQQGRSAEAAAALERSLRQSPDRSSLLQILQELGREYRRCQQPEKADEVWSRMETLFPNDVRVKEQIASLQFEAGDFENALVRYEELTRLQTDPWQATQNQLMTGDLHARLGRAEKARAIFEDVLSKLDSESWLYRDTRRRLEELFLSQGNRNGLIAYYEQWLTGHPEDLDAMTRLGRLLAGENRQEDARYWYQNALHRAPSNISLRKAMIEQWLRENNVAKAISEYEQLHRFDNGNADHVTEWGLLFLRRNDLAPDQRRRQAKEVWMQLLVDHEDDPDRHLRLAELFRRAELFDDALEHYQIAVTRSNNSLAALESLAQYLYSRNRKDEALAVLQQLVTGSRRSTASYLQLVDALTLLKEHSKALDAMQEACRLTPSFQDHLRFARMLRDFETNGEHPRTDDALGQLAIAMKLAETDDERRMIQDLKIETLKIAGQMESEIARLSQSVSADSEATSQDWTTLAIYQEAAGYTINAIDSITTALKLDSEAIAALTFAASLYEKTGRLRDAVETLQKLKTRDRKSMATLLKKIAVLEQRLGRSESAFQAARELQAASPGNPEALQLYADLCFQAGRENDGLQTLRRIVRVNPSDNQARLRLAEKLTQLDFTDEAIEVYWQALLLLDDQELQTQAVTSLAELCLKLERLDQLTKRLEQQGREQNRQKQMTVWLATVLQVAGDTATARQKLQSVLTSDRDDVDVLQRLSRLAEDEEDLIAAVEFQRRLQAVSPSDENRLRLVELLLQSGEVTEAEAVLARMPDLRGAGEEGPKTIDRLIELDELVTAKELCLQVLQANPDHWLMLQKLAVIEWRRGDRVAAEAACDQLLGLTLDQNTSVETLFKPASTAQNSVSILPDETRAKNRLSRHDEVTPDVVWNQLGEASSSLPKVAPFDTADYGDARIFCLELKRRCETDRGSLDAWIATLEQKANRNRQAAWDAWFVGWLQEFSDRASGRDVRQDHLTAAIRLAERGEPDGAMIVLTAAESLFEWSHFSQSQIRRDVDLHQAPDDVAAIILAFETALAERPGDVSINHREVLFQICEQFGHQALLVQMIQRLQTQNATREQQMVALEWHLRQQTSTTTELLTLLDRVHQASSAIVQQNESADPMFSSVTRRLRRVPQQILFTAVDRDTDAARLAILKAWVRYKADEPVSNSLAGFFSVSPDAAARGTQKQEHLQLDRYFDLVDLQLLQTIHASFPDPSDQITLLSACESERENVTSRERLILELALATFCWKNESAEDAILHLIRAAELAPGDESLRCRLIDLCQHVNKFREAMELAETLPESNPLLLKARQFKLLELAMLLSDRDRAVAAAERLSGLQLDQAGSAKLLQSLQQLDLQALAADVQARTMQPEAPVSLQPAYVTSSPYLRERRLNELRESRDLVGATRFAKQVLRQTRNSSTGLSFEDDENESLRATAFEVLSQAGELTGLIDRQKAQLEASPNSESLLWSLEEALQASNRTQEARSLRSRRFSLYRNGLPSTKIRLVEELLDDSRMEEAEAVYFEIMEKHPAFFWSEAIQRCSELLTESDQHERIVKATVSHLTDRLRFADQSQSRGLQSRGSQDRAFFYGLLIVEKSIEKSPETGAKLLSELLTAVQVIPESLQLDQRTVLWETPESFHVLTELLIPRTASEASSPRYGWSRERAPSALTGSDSSGPPEVLSAVFSGLVRSSVGRFRSTIQTAQQEFPAWQMARPLLIVAAVAENDRVEADRIVQQLVADETAGLPEIPALELATLLSHQGNKLQGNVQQDNKLQSDEWKSLAFALLQKCLASSSKAVPADSPVWVQLVTLSLELGREEEVRTALRAHVERSRSMAGQSSVAAVTAITPGKDAQEIVAARSFVRLGQPFEALSLLHQAGPSGQGQIAGQGQIGRVRIVRGRRDAGRPDEVLRSVRGSAFETISPQIMLRALEESLILPQPPQQSSVNFHLLLSETDSGFSELSCEAFPSVALHQRPTPSQSRELARALSQVLKQQSADLSLVTIAVALLINSEDETALEIVQSDLDAWWKRPIASEKTASPLTPELTPSQIQALESQALDLQELALIPHLAAVPESRVMRLLIPVYFRRCERLATKAKISHLHEAVLLAEAELMLRFGDREAAAVAWSGILDRVRLTAEARQAVMPGRKVDIRTELQRSLLK